LLLSIFFVVHRYNDLQRQLEDAGASIIEPLAVSSEYGMNLQNRESIGQLISVLHRRHSEIVRAISVYDEHNRLFVTSNFHLDPAELKIPDGTPFPRNLSVMRHGDIMILRTPIISESYSLMSLPSPTPNPPIICWDMWRWSWISSLYGCSSTKRFLSPA
jgi:two-component system sensor histidine kinase BarA